LTPSGHGIFEAGIAPDVVVAIPSSGTLLIPEDLDGMTSREFRGSDDTQLRRAVRLLTEDPDGTPRPAPGASPAPAVSAGPSDAPPSAQRRDVSHGSKEDPAA
jgi:hypothetical protein